MDLHNKKKRTELMIIFFMCFALMPDIISIAGHTIKAMYFILFILSIDIFSKKKISLPNGTLSLFFVYALIISLIVAFRWGIDRLSFNYLFGYVIIIIILTICSDFTRSDFELIFQKVWIIFLVVVLINDFRQGYRFVEYFQYGLSHPYINTVVTGGVNLEASWVSILSISFYSSKYRWIPVIISFVMSAIYASRVGLMICIFVMIVFVIGVMPKDTIWKVLKRRTTGLAFLFLGAMLIMVYASKSEILTHILTRFSAIGNDSGSMGRLNMWQYVWKAISDNPFGVGLGNSIKAIFNISSKSFVENNLHNLPIQMTLELGVFGGIAYIGIWLLFVKKEKKRIFNSPIEGMLFVYFISSLLQFRGGETIFFCILGAYLCCSKKYKMDITQELN